MNKLEDIKEKLWPTKTFVDTGDTLKEGFDAAIALGLPVKFTNWRDEQCVFHHGQWFLSGMSLPIHNDGVIATDNIKLYQYWIEKIYEPE